MVSVSNFPREIWLYTGYLDRLAVDFEKFLFGELSVTESFEVINITIGELTD